MFFSRIRRPETLSFLYFYLSKVSKKVFFHELDSNQRFPDVCLDFNRSDREFGNPVRSAAKKARHKERLTGVG